MRNNNTLSRAILAATLCGPGAVMAGGFALNEQSASAMGVANAGTAANPENATTVFFNPAGMSQLSGTTVSFGAAVLDIDAEVKDGTASATDNVGNDVSGSDGGDIADPAYLPNIFVTHEINDTVDVGIGLHAPYGLKADYDDDFVGRYFADKTELTAIALSPSIAVNNGEGFSMGIGVNIIYAKGRLTKYQDYSNYGLPQEGYFDTEGDDIGATISFGLLYELTDKTQIGLSGQTGTTLNLEGDSTLTNFPQVTASGVNLVTAKEDANVPLDIPESLTFGIRHKLTDTVTLLAGATWAKWSRFEALDIESREDGGTISAVGGPKYGDNSLIGHVSENWNDTWQVNVGGIWQATPAWAFKAGYAYDESPVDDNYRTARIPSNDRQWLTLGTQWNDAQSGWTVDVAAGVLLFDDVDVNEQEYTVDDEPVGNGASYSATYELSAWSAGVQVSKAF
ncbi:aromatic hydrocarbon degradation protein [Marinobacter sp. R17]|uniref:OmpP1/FadL family transporter n=1 Tax=Marinobacter sp. R17 TaxID=2484250 RepID=UPI000F4B3F53|nr:outer membrane protein transport protein [Marinobacter sp. R17]ROT94749.1 aromatic hydrocarbon degradation protein [Marinobacter sp. R17]